MKSYKVYFKISVFDGLIDTLYTDEFIITCEEDPYKRAVTVLKIRLAKYEINDYEIIDHSIKEIEDEPF